MNRQVASIRRESTHALCTHVSTIPPNAPTARFSASDNGSLVAIVVVVVTSRVKVSTSVIRLFAPWERKGTPRGRLEGGVCV